MRLCRFRSQNLVQVGFYDERRVVPLTLAAEAYATATGQRLELPASENLLDFLPPDGRAYAAARRLAEWLPEAGEAVSGSALKASETELLVPIPKPNKLFLLAGNYAEHIIEHGGAAPERAETFPYVFMKPPSTTLTDPGKPIRIPAVSPAAIDWELELAVVIGRRAKGVREADALQVVAGYTVINDISNRKFRPNPNRSKRDKDAFFDWLHGKWHDSFCPCGPCIASADAVANPQALEMTLRLNGETRQHGSTGQQIFPVAAVIEFISSFVTLEPGDIISTGTPSGVGNASGTYLKPGDRLEAGIASIGTLLSPVIAE
ncbi:MAG TPA: fumarylacetoacetate hydrolase family protein [Pirellulales bacterium]|jgi:2-keto-4-pentenoate hydratase/2-oxohepta-3-ene-1,7-dioic acid hydratase in catechol pathway|nr:fumarylacetoacetate hydrolase family protein [Pirellulales bacterium]